MYISEKLVEREDVRAKFADSIVRLGIIACAAVQIEIVICAELLLW